MTFYYCRFHQHSIETVCAQMAGAQKSCTPCEDSQPQTMHQFCHFQRVLFWRKCLATVLWATYSCKVGDIFCCYAISLPDDLRISWRAFTVPMVKCSIEYFSDLSTECFRSGRGMWLPCWCQLINKSLDYFLYTEINWCWLAACNQWAFRDVFG